MSSFSGLDANACLSPHLCLRRNPVELPVWLVPTGSHSRISVLHLVLASVDREPEIQNFDGTMLTTPCEMDVVPSKVSVYQAVTAQICDGGSCLMNDPSTCRKFDRLHAPNTSDSLALEVRKSVQTVFLRCPEVEQETVQWTSLKRVQKIMEGLGC